MHMVIHNAWKGDPYPIDTLFLYMANMSWNSAMNTAGTARMLTDKDPATGEYKIPRIIYADAFASEMVAYADLVLPDTTYLERHDCISLLDRPISDADGAADAIRQPVLAPDRDVRPFQDVLIDIGTRLKLPGLVETDGKARYPGGYPDYMVRHERRPGVGMLAGWRGEAGDKHGRGAPNPAQLDAYKQHQCFWRYELPEDQRFFRFANRGYLRWATEVGFIDKPDPIVLQLYSEPLQRFRLAAQGHGRVRPPPHLRERIAAHFDPLPTWYPPFEEGAIEPGSFPLRAVTQRPMAMYHSWGGHNAWLRQIHGHNRLYLSRRTGACYGLADDDWVWVVSHHGRIKVQIKLMEGVNDDTVWTWNAIAKRSGAWQLHPDAPEAIRGFLLNDLIAELLPPQKDGQRYANIDPITGQAAWYDLRVRLEKPAPIEARLVEAPLPEPPGLPRRPRLLQYGARFRGRPEKVG
jgi:anaerobic selenocysteine-containing dehydrogenase